MTHTTNARIAGFTFLFYIAGGIASMVLFGQATGGQRDQYKAREHHAACPSATPDHCPRLAHGRVCNRAGCDAVRDHARPGLRPRNVGFDLSRWRGLAQRDFHSRYAGIAVARHIYRTKGAGCRDTAGAQQLPSRWARLEYERNLVRDGQHSVLVSVSPRPDNPSSTGVARPCCLGHSHGGPSCATRWFFERLGHVIHVVTNGRV